MSISIHKDNLIIALRVAINALSKEEKLLYGEDFKSTYVTGLEETIKAFNYLMPGDSVKII